MRRSSWWRFGARSAAAPAVAGELPEEPGAEELPAIVAVQVVVTVPRIWQWPRAARMASCKVWMQFHDGD